jgi:hypothetical protein
MYDEPLAMPAQARQHFSACDRCRLRYQEIARMAGAGTALLAVKDGPVDAAHALAQVRARIAADRAGTLAHRPGTGSLSVRRRTVLAPAAGLVAAAVLAGSLILTPAGSLAQSFITIFEPKSFTPVTVSTTDVQDLRNLPDLRAFGTVHLPKTRLQPVADRATAERATGLRMHLPSSLPSAVPASVSYMVLPRSAATFTFSAARAAAAATHGAALPPMPRKLDGSTLQVTAGPALAAVYGGGPGSSTSGSSNALSGIPTLVVAQSALPQVDSTGASIATIEGYLLKLPGVTPHLAQEIRSIGHPASTMPIPIPLDFADTQTVQVQGVQGLAVGDQTGLGSGVIWQKDGEVYGVAGTLPESQIIAIANSLQ